MALSHELISQFAKQIAPKDKIVNKESTVEGVIHVDEKGNKYVQLAGSDQLTPLTTGDLSSMCVTAKDSDRVIVQIKNHTATVVGNMTSPAGSTGSIGDIDDKISEFDVLLADHIQTSTAYIKQLQSESAKIADLEAAEARIGDLEVDVASIKELTVEGAVIERLEAGEAKITSLEADVAEIKDLNADNIDVTELNASFINFSKATGDRLDVNEANIKDLDAKKLTAEQADLKYANIAFANIDKAAIETFFAKSGVIEDWTSENGIVTGKLVAVSIDADNITSGSLLAERIMLQGDDGLFYKLNVDAMGKATADALPQEEQEKLKNGIHGGTIIAESITADKISVSDLVAFGATIGGFKIGKNSENQPNSIHSIAKDSVDNTTRGIYLDSDGQMSVGDETNYLRFYYDEVEDKYRFEIAADSIHLGTNKTSIEDSIVENESSIKQLAESIQMVITGPDGQSAMTQTDKGWTFDISSITNSINELESELARSGVKTDWVEVTTYNGKPCIELGESENGFRLRITNSEIQFVNGVNIPAYIASNEDDVSKLMIEKAEVKGELQIGDFIWQKRSNGNVGLMWIGGNS